MYRGKESKKIGNDDKKHAPVKALFVWPGPGLLGESNELFNVHSWVEEGCPKKKRYLLDHMKYLSCTYPPPPSLLLPSQASFPALQCVCHRSYKKKVVENCIHTIRLNFNHAAAMCLQGLVKESFFFFFVPLPPSVTFHWLWSCICSFRLFLREKNMGKPNRCFH